VDLYYNLLIPISQFKAYKSFAPFFQDFPLVLSVAQYIFDLLN